MLHKNIRTSIYDCIIPLYSTSQQEITSLAVDSATASSVGGGNHSVGHGHFSYTTNRGRQSPSISPQLHHQNAHHSTLHNGMCCVRSKPPHRTFFYYFIAMPLTATILTPTALLLQKEKKNTDKVDNKNYSLHYDG